MLLSCGADITLENDNGDTVLDIAGERLRKHILSELGERGGREKGMTIAINISFPRVHQS